MEKAQRNTLIWRLSSVTFLEIALFWTIWGLFTGIWSTTSEVKLTSWITICLPRPSWRGWDCALGPLWTLVTMEALFEAMKREEEKDLASGMFWGLIYGVATLFAYLITSGSIGISPEWVMLMLVPLYLAEERTGIGWVLSCALFYGLTYGALSGVFLYLCCCVVALLLSPIRWAVYNPKSVLRWLSAGDITAKTAPKPNDTP